MKVTYDKRTYNIGKTFETDNGKAMLTASCSEEKIGMLMLDGEYIGKMWAGMKPVHDINKITEDEFKSACGVNLNIKEVKREFSPVTITLETEDELKYMWAALASPKCTIIGNGNDWNAGKFTTVNGADTWKSVDLACIELGLKDSCSSFKE